MHFAVFLGTTLAVSGVPVIVQFFLDLDQFQIGFGMLEQVAATLKNLLAWLIVSLILVARSRGHSFGCMLDGPSDLSP